MFMWSPQSKLRGSSASFNASRCVLPVQSVDGVVHARKLEAELEVPSSERLHGGPKHPYDHITHLGELLAHRLAPRLVLRCEVQLGDVDRLIADPFQVEVAVQDRRDQSKVGRDR